MANPHLRKLVISLRASLWARPLLCIALSVIAGVGLPALEQRWTILSHLHQGPLAAVLRPSPDGTRQLLTAAVGALATIAAVGFSMMMVTVQLASSQYTARLLRTFMADGIIQWVLGIFTATIVYLLLVLRSVHAEDGSAQFVPLVSFVLALVLTVGCVSLLPFLLHHTTRSIDASAIIARVGKQTLAILRGMKLDRSRTVDDLALEPAVQPGHLHGNRTGYVQLIDEEALVRALPRGTRVARVEVRTGDFVVPGIPLVSFWPAAKLPGPVQKRVDRAIAVGSERTMAQDVLYGVRKLVDIALRALSPGINDVTTALMVVNELGAIVGAVAARETPGEGWVAREYRGIPVLVNAFGLQPVLDEAYSELPTAAREHPRVLGRILETLTDAARQARHPEVMALLRRHGEEIASAVDGTLIRAGEQASLQERLLAMRAALEHAPEPPHRPEPIH